MVTCVIVGLNEWERFTLPMIESCKASNPDLSLVCVDNGSQSAYPAVDGVILIRSIERKSYAGGINLGMKAIAGDWVMVVNNDVLISKPLCERIERLNPNELHGFYLVSKDEPGLFGWDYLSGWCLIFNRHLWNAIGDFDEACAPMYFEDADYSIRAVRAGFGLRLHDRDEWGIKHLEDSRHKERREYMKAHNEQRQAIKQYVREKHG